MSSEKALQTALVVDDDPGLRAVLRHILELEGWRVVEAEDGKEALACAADEDLDVVITDVEMPGMDGIQLATRLRRRRHAVPLVAITRHPPQGVDAALFDEVFTKPVSVPALREWLAHH
jgi:CheY-like chemotaxis protein